MVQQKGTDQMFRSLWFSWMGVGVYEVVLLRVLTKITIPYGSPPVNKHKGTDQMIGSLWFSWLGVGVYGRYCTRTWWYLVPRWYYLLKLQSHIIKIMHYSKGCRANFGRHSQNLPVLGRPMYWYQYWYLTLHFTVGWLGWVDVW